MKIEARSIPGFLKNPGSCRVVLLHGEDVGLIRARADALAAAVLGEQDDPFRLAWLEPESHGRLVEEASSLALTGGRRVVRVRDAGDKLTDSVKQALDGKGQALLILEAPGLNSRAKLRALVEKAADAAAIACYPEEGRSLQATIRQVLTERGVAIETEALDYLTGQLGADQAQTRQELDKLALYVGANGKVDLAAAEACVGDAASLSLEDALFAATAGDRAGADRALRVALAEGATPVGVVRAALMHLQRLHRARLAVARGASAQQAAKEARPPVFFRRLPEFTRALSAWSVEGLERAMNSILSAELACKRTGAPAELIGANVIRALAAHAGRG
jgi:DNA polymerase-3 subunit delta